MILYQFGFLIENELLCHSLKRPQEYALLLNVSSVYLNEAVKKTTGYKCLCTEKRFNGNA